MRISRSSRRFLILACSLILFVLALAPSYAKGGGGLGGCPTPGDETWYYTDATHAVKVGECVSDCCNCTTCTCTGTITSFPVHIPVNWLWCPPSS